MLNGYEYKYYRFLKKREKQYRVDFSQFEVRQTKGLVSVVLPVYNGEDLVEYSIKSILEQTYRNIELIIVDDGSVDDTLKIANAWAQKDDRITVVHQENCKLPRALNKGFSYANGEFLTWTSADNIMHTDCIEKLVTFLKENPKVAMCYANLRVIDENGEPIQSNTWYSNGEHTGNVYLPNATLRLNTYAENTVAAAFMYRRAVPMLIGEYDPELYTVEDYEYWMRINDAFILTHTDFEDIIYDYRFHEKSLTAKAKELHINEIREKLMLMEDYRQDWLIRPMCWVLNGDAGIESWKQLVQEAGHISRTEEDAAALIWPELGTGLVQVTVLQEDSEAELPPRITGDAIRVLVRNGAAQQQDIGKFDLLIQIGDREKSIPDHWVRAKDEKAAFDLIQIYSKMRWFGEMCARNRSREDSPQYKATIVLCTYKRIDKAKQALQAMTTQTANAADYEILVVNNDAGSQEMKRVVDCINQNGETKACVRYIDCPYLGLSFARNFSLYAANGEFLLYVDDDGIMLEDCLEKLIDAFRSHPEAGVIGGQILLKNPERFANVILPGYESLWSERTFAKKTYFTVEDDCDLPYGCNYAVRRNVLRELGGFRVSYGRSGKDFAGGEEIVLSHLVQKSEMTIGIEPSAIVIHDVDESRFTLDHVSKTIRASRLTNRLMKMDLYRPFDLRMNEENYQLTLAVTNLEQLLDQGVSENYLRIQYALFDIKATQEAIQEGNLDYQIMERAKLVEGNPDSQIMEDVQHLSTDELEMQTKKRRSFINRSVGAVILAVGKVFDVGKLGDKARLMEEELAFNGIRRTFKKMLVLFGKKLFKSGKKNKILDSLNANEQKRIQAQESTDTRLTAIKDYIYDVEQRSIRMARIAQINELRQKKKLLLIGTAEHKNIGDAAITKAEQELLLELFPEYYQMEFSTYEMDEDMYSFFQAIVHKDDLFFLHGGGNIGNRYMPEEKLRRRVLEDYPDHRIIIMPQTISFTDDPAGQEQLEISGRCYNQHPDLTILVRGMKSFSFAKEYFSNARIAMMPDAALWLRGIISTERKGALVCLRTDDETGLTAQEQTAIMNAVQSLIPDVERSNNMADKEISRERRAAVVSRELKRFAGKRVVITDRLHGMIFSAITGTPVVVMKSSDQKIEEYYQTFFTDSNSVFYIGTDLDALETAVVSALAVEQPKLPHEQKDQLTHLRENLWEF